MAALFVMGGTIEHLPIGRQVSFPGHDLGSTGSATRNFAAPAFDGDPVFATQEEIDRYGKVKTTEVMIPEDPANRLNELPTDMAPIPPIGPIPGRGRPPYHQRCRALRTTARSLHHAKTQPIILDTERHAGPDRCRAKVVEDHRRQARPLAVWISGSEAAALHETPTAHNHAHRMRL